MSSNLRMSWPKRDFSRVPYPVFFDDEVYGLEQEKLFGGPTWSFLGLEAELPKPGDFIVTYLGQIVVVVHRGGDGVIHAFENRCAHRGTMVVREPRGNRMEHTCVYHHWCYNSKGDLMSVPFLRGVRGKGGMPSTFNKAERGLKKIRIATYKGNLFGSLSDDVEPIEDYLGEMARSYFDRLFHRPIEILGYHRQRIPANWKLYWENLTDTYHAGLLHQMGAAMGISRVTQEGAIRMDRRKRHVRSYYVYNSDDQATVSEGYDDTSVLNHGTKLEDTSAFDYKLEWQDNLNLDMLAVFPNAFFQQSGNRLLARQIRPKNPNEFELLWTYFGFTDDPPDLRRRRLVQSNNSGPAGIVAMEDGEAGVLIQRALRREGHSAIELGGLGPIEDADTLATEVATRGFWMNYHSLMGFEPAEG